MKLLNIYSLGLGVLLLGLVPNSAMGVSLDLFEDTNENSTTITLPSEFGGGSFPSSYDGQQAELNGNQQFGQPLIPSFDTDTGLSGVIGTQRTISVTENSGSGLINLKVDPTAEQVSFSVASGTNGSASILWDSITEAEEDLTASGTDNKFLIRINSIDIISGVTLNFEVEDEFGHSGTISQHVSSTGDVLFPYKNVVNNDPNNPVSFTDARSVKLFTSNEPDSLDFTFDFIETTDVPFEFSPSLGIILCGSFFGIHKLRKRLQNN